MQPEYDNDFLLCVIAKKIRSYFIGYAEESYERFGILLSLPNSFESCVELVKES